MPVSQLAHDVQIETPSPLTGHHTTHSVASRIGRDSILRPENRAGPAAYPLSNPLRLRTILKWHSFRCPNGDCLQSVYQSPPRSLLSPFLRTPAFHNRYSISRGIPGRFSRTHT